MIMFRRIATLLLTLSVTFVGLLASPHAAACCVVRQASAHDCCKVAAKLSGPDCCRGNQQLTDRVVHNQHAPQPALPVALGEPMLDMQHLAVEATVATPLPRGLAPPGSLIAQHTSLLL
jgi:hypothetical protein